jgi:hypothetical protein
MLIAVPYFGTDERFKRLLSIWWDSYAASGTTIPATLVADFESDVPRDYPCLKVDTWPANEAMRGHAFDRKGAIVVCAAQILGNFLAVDMDAFLMRDPRKYIERLRDMPFAMAADGWTRPIVLAHHGYVEISQRQAGVLWFGPCDRAKLLDDYLTMFRRLRVDHGEDSLLEQYTWSGLWHTMGRHDMPLELNWQYCREPEIGKDRAAIWHEHGNEKWKRL